MATTAKSFQLMDASGINISPVTDITSLYYEVERRDTKLDASIITRQYLYSGFPVGVNIDPNISTTVQKKSNIPTLSSSNPQYKLLDQYNNDIIISNVSTSIIPGTIYRQLNVKNYNLTEIL